MVIKFALLDPDNNLLTFGQINYYKYHFLQFRVNRGPILVRSDLTIPTFLVFCKSRFHPIPYHRRSPYPYSRPNN